MTKESYPKVPPRAGCVTAHKWEKINHGYKLTVVIRGLRVHDTAAETSEEFTILMAGFMHTVRALRKRGVDIEEALRIKK